MRFEKFYKYNNISFENINKALFEEVRDYFQSRFTKKGVNKIFLSSDEQLKESGFYDKFPHLR